MEEIDTSYKILYEDDKLIAVDKSGNCPVHPGGIRFKDNSLLTELEKNLEIKLYPIYRIDRETSGIVVFAKDNSIIKDVQLKNKIYLAICKGNVKEQEINLPLGQGGGEYMNWKVVVDKNGKECKTLITPLKTNKDYSLIKVQILTGRQHQIRAHLKAINHDIVGDKVYGESDKIFKDYVDSKLVLPYNKEEMNRQALHMHSIEINGNKIVSDLPSDMKELLERVKLF